MKKNKEKKLITTSLEPVPYVKALMDFNEVSAKGKKELSKKIEEEIKSCKDVPGVQQEAFIINSIVVEILLGFKVLKPEVDIKPFLPLLEEGVSDSWNTYIKSTVEFMASYKVLDVYFNETN